MILHAEGRRWARKVAPRVLLGVAVVAFSGFSQLQRDGSPRREGAANRVEGFLFQQIGELEQEVAASGREATVVYPKYAQAHNDLGIVLESLGNVARAEEAYKIALAFQPQLGAAHTNLALLYEKAGRIDQAAEHWGARVKLGPTDDPWVLTARERLHKYRLAVPQTEEELAQERAARVRLNIQEGRRHYDAKAWDAAVDAFQRALEIEPRHSEAAGLLRKARSKSQRVRQAKIQAVQRAHAQAKREAVEKLKRPTRAQVTPQQPEQGSAVLKEPVPPPPQAQEIRLATQRAEAEAKARALRRQMEEQAQTERALLERRRAEEFLRALDLKRSGQHKRQSDKAPLPPIREASQPPVQEEQREPVRLSVQVQTLEAEEPAAAPEETVPSEALESAKALALSLADEKAKARERTVTELYQRGMAATRKGRHEEAATLFEQVLTLRPDHRPARQGLERVRKALSQAKRAARR